MLLIDSRVGSNDILHYVKPWGIEAELVTLDSADCAFLGNGPDCRPVPVGIELKKLDDLLQCVTTGRLSGGQLPKMVKQYEHRWLVIEGAYRPAPLDGEIQTLWTKDPTDLAESEALYGRWYAAKHGQRRYMYRDIEHYLTTLEMKGAIRLRRTWSRYETARVVAALYSWWVNKEWDEHTAHLSIDTTLDTALLVRPSLVRRVAAELPGIGYQKSGEVSAKFKSVMDLALADEQAWREIPGVGKTLSKRIVAAINGEKRGT